MQAAAVVSLEPMHGAGLCSVPGTPFTTIIAIVSRAVSLLCCRTCVACAYFQAMKTGDQTAANKAANDAAKAAAEAADKVLKSGGTPAAAAEAARNAAKGGQVGGDLE